MNKDQMAANAVSQKQNGAESTFQFVDDRPETVAQKKIQEMGNNSLRAKQAAQLKVMTNSKSAQLRRPIQKKENLTGLPDSPKIGMKIPFRKSLNDLKVHRNPDNPVQLNAYATTQNPGIYLASGLQNHLPHETFHVVRQKHGRGKPITKVNGESKKNNISLEKEADVLGAKTSPGFNSKLKQTNTSDSQHLIQLMKWPTKKNKQPNMVGSNWSDADIEDVQYLYDWCKNISQFNKIISTITYDEWYAREQFIKDDDWDEFDTELASSSSKEEVLSLFQYFKLKKAKPRVLKTYDDTSYEFPSEKAKELVIGAGMTLQDLERDDLRGYVDTLAINDKEYSKHVWEKQANSQVLTIEERPLKNAEIKSALEKLQSEVAELLKAKTDRDKELAAIKLHNDRVAAMVIKAAALPSYAGVTGNVLAKKIWDASVALAGKTGYLEADTTVYPKATIIAATALLRTFSSDWTEKYGENEYLCNPHCPGGGYPSDKTGHSNESSRTSIYQADFIATWGGKVTVIHINSDSI